MRILSLTQLKTVTIGMISNNDIVLLQICFSLKFFSFFAENIILNMLCKIKIRGSAEKLSFGKGFPPLE